MLVGCGTSPGPDPRLPAWVEAVPSPQAGLTVQLRGYDEQAPWSLEKEELAEEEGGRASGKVGSGYGWGLALFLVMPQALISLSLVFSSEQLLPVSKDGCGLR